MERAAELDPRDAQTLDTVSEVHWRFGRTAEAKMWLTRAVAVAEPDDVGMKLALPVWEWEVGGNPRPLHQAIESIRATNPAAVRIIAPLWLECALAERDATAATEALKVLDESEISLDEVRLNRAFMEGLIARMAKDEGKARVAFAAARTEQEKVIQAQPEFGPAWCAMGIIDAALGRKEDALREGRRAIELLPVEKDAAFGRCLVRWFAVIAAWTGEKDLACQQLATLVGPPRFLNYGELKLFPLWDPLRGDPRFEKIVASLAPK
jgi:serine/threonine-protein kinase